jgi:O-antigen/teichoic acid export membrane protein
MAGMEAAEIGVFTAAFAIVVPANRLLLGGFANVILAGFSRALAEEGRDGLNRLYSLFIRVSTALTTPLLVGAAVFADYLVRIPIEGDPASAASVLRVLACAFIIIRLCGGGSHIGVFFALGGQRTALAIRSAFALIAVVATFLAAQHGALVAAVAAGCASAAVVAFEWAWVRRAYRMRLPFATNLRLTLLALFGAVPAAVVLRLTQGVVWTMAAAALFAVGEIVCGFCAGVLEPGEAREIAGGGFAGRAIGLLERRRMAPPGGQGGDGGSF